MHISDGVLSVPVFTGGAVAAAAMTVYSLKKTKNEDIPRIAVMTAAFFVASLIHIKIGPTSGHLVLNGLIGVVLGISAFPAIVVALLLQAIMFQHGGITTLGVNAIAMGLPALLAYGIFSLNKYIKFKKEYARAVLSFLAGSVAVLLSAVFISIFLITTGEEFVATAKVIMAANGVIAVIEGLATSFIISFLIRVKPDILA